MRIRSQLIYRGGGGGITSSCSSRIKQNEIQNYSFHIQVKEKNMEIMSLE